MTEVVVIVVSLGLRRPLGVLVVRDLLLQGPIRTYTGCPGEGETQLRGFVCGL